MKKLFLFLIVTFCFACQDSNETQMTEELEDEDYFVFGSFYGLAPSRDENRIELFKLSKNSLFEDTKDQYPGSIVPYPGEFTQNRQDKYDEVKDLAAKIPAQLLSKSSGPIGCPDCTDGGGIYIEIKVGNRISYWLIDKQRTPEYLVDFVNTVDEKIQILK